MKILVTGGCGYIGSKMIREIPKVYPNATIRIVDNFFREKHNSLWDLPEAEYEFFEYDIRNKDQMMKATKDVDVIYDFAGITNAPISFEREELTKDVNLNGVINLINAFVENGCKKYVYASTASVYGPTKDVVNETSQCNPASPYGKYKLLAEQHLIKSSKEKDLDITALRLGTVYGWSVGMRFDTVIDRFCYLASIGAPLTVHIPALKEKRPYIHIEDVIRAFFFATNNKNTKGEVYNTVGQNSGIQEVLDAIKKIKPDVKTVLTENPTLNQLSYVLDSSKIIKLGFETKFDLYHGIREIISKFSHIR